MAGLIAYIAYDSNGRQTGQGSGHGSCTGMYGHGHGRLSVDTVTLQQAFQHGNGFSESSMERIANTRILQALVPGMEYAGQSRQDGRNDPSFKFPNIHTLPSDQVVTAMRMLKTFLGYNVDMATLREYEFTMDELFPIALFYNKAGKTSDAYPLLAAATKAELVAHFQENPPSRYDWNSMSIGLRRVPTAGAILPLIRGEIRAGYQLPLIKGYLKEGSLLHVCAHATPNPSHSFDASSAARGFDIEEGLRKANADVRNWWNMIPDDASYSVNHPLIHFTEEAFSGPSVTNSSNSEHAVLDWLATSLGK